jgi:hypothetical protein
METPCIVEERDLDRSFYVKRKLNPESPIVKDGMLHRLDKDVCTVRTAIVTNLPPRSPISASVSRSSRSPSIRTWTPRRSIHDSARRTFNAGVGISASPAAPLGRNADCRSPSIATLFATPRTSPTLSLARVSTIELYGESDELTLSLQST